MRTADDDWMLLELIAYFDAVENATTAITGTSYGKHIQVTFCLRPPPLLSRLCVHSPDGASFRCKPHILATEADLALIRVDVGGSHSLESGLLRLPGRRRRRVREAVAHSPAEGPDGLYFHPKDIGLLRHRRAGSTAAAGEYIVAGFRYTPFHHPGGGFELCLYDSERPDCRKVYALTLSLQGRQKFRKAYEKKVFLHTICKVVTIGGDGGTMAFVDLWRGVIFCDVLRLETEATYATTTQSHHPLAWVRLAA